jgi:hypothetical protein
MEVVIEVKDNALVYPSLSSAVIWIYVYIHIHIKADIRNKIQQYVTKEMIIERKSVHKCAYTQT